MTSDNYKDALQQAKTDIEVAIRNRDYWTLQIVRLEQLIKSLSQMVATTEKARAKFDALEKALGFTETVNTIIRNSHTPMSAINVRDKLLEMGYDLAYYSRQEGKSDDLHQSFPATGTPQARNCLREERRPCGERQCYTVLNQ